MSEKTHMPSDAPEEERVRQTLRLVPRPEADPAFRARLKEEFSSGAIQARAERAPGAAEARVARGAARAPWWRNFLSVPRLWIPATAAAAAALALVVGVMNQGPAWTVASVSGSGVVRVDGKPVAMTDRTELARRITPGARLEVPEGAEINLVADKTLAVLVTPGSDLIVPPSPARWFARESELRVQHGLLRLTTGADFHGARLTVYTPEAMARVTGTTFTVISDPEIGTCVCVYEGVVHVGRKSGQDMVPVPAGMRRILYADERPPVVREIRKDERVFLDEYRSHMRSMMH